MHRATARALPRSRRSRSTVRKGTFLLGELANQLGAEPTARANDQDRIGLQGLDLVQTWWLRSSGELCLRQVDGPAIATVSSARFESYSRICVRRPVVVHQKCRRCSPGSGGVTHAAAHEDCGVRPSSTVTSLPKDSPARRSTHAPKIRPVATETYLSHGSAWIPRVVPTGSVERDVVLDGVESDFSCEHLLALPVFLEPAAVIAVNRQVQ